MIIEAVHPHYQYYQLLYQARRMASERAAEQLAEKLVKAGIPVCIKLELKLLDVKFSLEVCLRISPA